MRWIGSAAVSVAIRRRPARRRETKTRPWSTLPRGPLSGLWNASIEVRVGLDDVIGAVDPAGHHDEDALIPERRVEVATADGVEKVGRAVVARLARRPHGARHHDWLPQVVAEVPEERGLLHRIGALDDDDPVDPGLGGERPDPPAELEQPREREMAGRRAPEVDRARRRRSPRSPGCGRGWPRRRGDGTLPPATGSTAIEMVPPVKTTATRLIGSAGSGSRLGDRHGGRLGRRSPGRSRTADRRRCGDPGSRLDRATVWCAANGRRRRIDPDMGHPFVADRSTPRREPP